VHSIAVALLLDRDRLHFFEDIGYEHAPFNHCPPQPGYSRNHCQCGPEHTFGQCLRRAGPISRRMGPRADQRCRLRNGRCVPVAVRRYDGLGYDSRSPQAGAGHDSGEVKAHTVLCIYTIIFLCKRLYNAQKVKDEHWMHGHGRRSECNMSFPGPHSGSDAGLKACIACVV
jgi:hypothetical protein